MALKQPGRGFSAQPMVTPEGTLHGGLADSVLLWPLGPAKSQLINSQAYSFTDSPVSPN